MTGADKSIIKFDAEHSLDMALSPEEGEMEESFSDVKRTPEKTSYSNRKHQPEKITPRAEKPARSHRSRFTNSYGPGQIVDTYSDMLSDASNVIHVNQVSRAT